MFSKSSNNKGKLFIDLFDNKDHNECKMKYNVLFYMLCSFYDGRKVFDVNKKDVDTTLKHNKEAIILYLNILHSILNNQKLDEDILKCINFDFVDVVKGSVDKNTLEGKRIIINQIRNAFAHKSGSVYFYIDNDTKRVRINNKSWFSVDVKVDDLNQLFSSVIKDDNFNQTFIKDLIQKLNIYSTFNLNNNEIILLLCSLMIYNKESIFDQFMSTQSAYLFSGNFSIEHPNQQLETKEILNSFFDKYNLSFELIDDENYFDKDWGNLVDKNNIDPSKPTYNYIFDSMPYDYTSNKNIPIPYFLTKFRNALSHGHIIFGSDEVTFYDVNEKTNPDLKYEMKIDNYEIKRFLYSDYFFESILTPINEHMDNKSDEFYLVEKMKFNQQFKNYMNSFRNRFTNLDEKELILYMYTNNKFSSYLANNLSNSEEFYEYKLSDGTLLYDYLLSLSDDSEKEDEYYIDAMETFILNGYRYLYEYMDDYLNLRDSAFIDSKSDEFFKYYYLFLKNYSTTKRNSKDISKVSEEETKEIRKQFLVASLHDNNYKDAYKSFLIVSMQKSNYSEIERIKILDKLYNTNVNGYSDYKVLNSLTNLLEHCSFDSVNLGNLYDKFKPYTKNRFDIKDDLEFLRFIKNMFMKILKMDIETEGLFREYKDFMFKDMRECDILTIILLLNLNQKIQELKEKQENKVRDYTRKLK